MSTVTVTGGLDAPHVQPLGERPVVDSPALSQISCLSASPESPDAEPKSNQNESDADFLKLCKDGGHKGLLEVDEPMKSSAPVQYKRVGGDWYYQEDISKDGNEVTPRSNIRDTDSEFVKLAKQGGHEGLLTIESGNEEHPFFNCRGRYIRKEERMSPSSRSPAGRKPAKTNIAPGNPIWLGGSGPEKGFTPGKRFVQRQNKETPFALSDDWQGAPCRNPDKI